MYSDRIFKCSMRDQLELKFLISHLTTNVGTVGDQLYFGVFFFISYILKRQNFMEARVLLPWHLAAGSSLDS